jgi:protocatechuate 3,4-dioxygenase beta subunit
VIDLWQADAAGRYAHPGDDRAAPLDPDFLGCARLRTDAQGRHAVKTIKPGEYGSRASKLPRWAAPGGTQEKDALVAQWDIVLLFG